MVKIHKKWPFNYIRQILFGIEHGESDIRELLQTDELMWIAGFAGLMITIITINFYVIKAAIANPWIVLEGNEKLLMTNKEFYWTKQNTDD